MKQEDKAQFWHEQIDSWSKSDLAQRRYCEDNNLSYSSFTYWRGKQQASKTVASKWLPIKMTVPSVLVNLDRTLLLEIFQTSRLTYRHCSNEAFPGCNTSYICGHNLFHMFTFAGICT